jgi:CMP/dCMP kinase
MIIAIDGPAGAGKSTIAKILAKKIGFLYIDTGAMYRALTLKAIENSIIATNEESVVSLAEKTSIELINELDGGIKVLLDGVDVSLAIREPRITKLVSDISRIKGVRQILVKLQRKMGEKRDSILDGRDIATVVFPDANKKFYLDANLDERTKRRHKELVQMGKSISLADVASDISRRDNIDSTREIAPLKRAADAIYIDTTNMSINEVVDTIFAQIKL